MFKYKKCSHVNFFDESRPSSQRDIVRVIFEIWMRFYTYRYIYQISAISQTIPRWDKHIFERILLSWENTFLSSDLSSLLAITHWGMFNLKRDLIEIYVFSSSYLITILMILMIWGGIFIFRNKLSGLISNSRVFRRIKFIFNLRFY